jgi:hypothetical protein
MQEPVEGGLGTGVGHVPGHGLGHRLARRRERHVADGGDPPAMTASESAQKSSAQTGSPGSAAATCAVQRLDRVPGQDAVRGVIPTVQGSEDGRLCTTARRPQHSG